MRRLASFGSVVLWLFASGCRGTPPPLSADAGPIAELITILESDSLRREESPSDRLTAWQRLRDLILQGGDKLTRQALSRLDHPDSSVRRGAQIILALTEAVPASVWEDLTRSPRNEIRTLALMRRHLDFDDFGVLDVCGPYGDLGPLREAAGELRELLEPREKEIAGWSKDFAADYRASMAPRYARFWEHILPAEQRLADIDGDGIPEVIVAAELWKGGGYKHRWSFIAVLRRSHRGAPYGVAFFKLLDEESLCGLAVADFDGDGILECAVRHYWLATNNGCTTLTMLSGRHLPNAPAIESWKPAYRLTLLPRREGTPAEFVGTLTYRLANTGTVTERAGALAVESRVYRWSRAGFREICRVYVPLD